MVIVVLGAALGILIALQYLPGLDNVINILQNDIAKTFGRATTHVLSYTNLSPKNNLLITLALAAVMPALIALAFFLAVGATEMGRKIITGVITVLLIVAFFLSPQHYALPLVFLAGLLILTLVIVATKILTFLFAMFGTAIAGTQALNLWTHKSLTSVSINTTQIAHILNLPVSNMTILFSALFLAIIVFGFLNMFAKSNLPKIKP
jgi:hypothetical protein